MQTITFVQIIERIRQFHLPHFDMVIGIANGGLVPASLVAFKLGVELSTVRINFRDEKNIPVQDAPIVLSYAEKISNKKLLIIDDVSVTGKTLEKAKEIFIGNDIRTLVFKGKADYVLFPELSECVNWPWKNHEGRNEL